MPGDSLREPAFEGEPNSPPFRSEVDSFLPQDREVSGKMGISGGYDGSVYIGEHAGSERHGYGTVFFLDGVCVTGIFCMGRCERGLQLHQGQCFEYENGQVIRPCEVCDADPNLLLLASSRIASHFQNLLRDCTHTQAPREGIFYDGRQGPERCSSIPLQFHQETNAWHEEVPHATHNSTPGSSATDAGMHVRCRRRRNDLREELAHTASPEAVFSCAGPVATEFFSFFRFVRRFFAFLFPFLSLPGICCSPCPVDSLDIEREFIVSGASLQRSFDSPGLSLYVSGAALCCAIAAVVLFSLGVNYQGPLTQGGISVQEVVFPFFAWVINALVCASYFGFRRSPHGLERMNRELTAELTALAANVVDSKSDICIYSWDETGRDKVKNKRYRIKWALLSFLVASLVSASVPIARWLLGFKGLGNTTRDTLAVLFAAAAESFFIFVSTYYFLKGLDMQREERSKLAVLTRIAYIERKSLLSPGTYTKDHFCCDAPLDISDLKNGFSGWFTTRSLVLCASPGANHQSREAAVSIVIITVFIIATIVISFDMYNKFYIETNEYSHALVVAFALLITWGPMCIQYLNVCSSIRTELKRHLYIMDVTSLYHRLHNRDVEASSIIHACRAMAAAHDVYPLLLNIVLHPFFVWILIIWILFAILSSIVSFVNSKSVVVNYWDANEIFLRLLVYIFSILTLFHAFLHTNCFFSRHSVHLFSYYLSRIMLHDYSFLLLFISGTLRFFSFDPIRMRLISFRPLVIDGTEWDTICFLMFDQLLFVILLVVIPNGPENAGRLRFLTTECPNFRDNIWIAVDLARRLRLQTCHSKSFTSFPVTLSAMNKSCAFINAEEFNEGQDEIAARYKAYICRSAEESGNSSGSSLAPDAVRPLDTNGEPFDEATEEYILQHYQHLVLQSPYWATTAEASYVFQSPFTDGSLTTVPSVEVVRFSGVPIKYYHVSGTRHPDCYNAASCRRYDPYNFFGVFYRPATAIAMKRYAVQNRCCHSPRWVSLQRSQQYNAQLLRHIKPLSLVLNEEVIQLVNTALTTNPSVLENAAVKQVRCKSIRDEFLRAFEIFIDVTFSHWTSYLSRLVSFWKMKPMIRNISSFSAVTAMDLLSLQQRQSMLSYHEWENAKSRGRLQCARHVKWSLEERAMALSAEQEHMHELYEVPLAAISEEPHACDEKEITILQILYRRTNIDTTARENICSFLLRIVALKSPLDDCCYC
eukprot:gene7091-5025_t